MNFAELFKDQVVYMYCYDCDLVLGKPDFSYEAVTKDKIENHKDHILTQSEWNAAVSSGKRKDKGPKHGPPHNGS